MPLTDESENLEYAKIVGILDGVFRRACQKDEFEYICSLLRVRGIEAPGWDPFAETQLMFNEMTSLIQSPLRPETSVRLALLLYCHLVEADAPYEILSNLFSTIAGDRYNADPFRSLYRKKGKGLWKQPVPPSVPMKIRCLCEAAEKQGVSELPRLLNWMFNDVVRNAFVHSDYTIHDGEFRVRNALFRRGDVLEQMIDLKSLINVVNRGLAFFNGFIQVYTNHRLSYKENKKIVGRMGHNEEYVEIEVHGDPEHGLCGFGCTVKG